MIDDDPEDFQDSGPFCRHWSDGDCEEVCGHCGHRCGEHGWGYGLCSHDGCDCADWVERAP